MSSNIKLAKKETNTHLPSNIICVFVILLLTFILANLVNFKFLQVRDCKMERKIQDAWPTAERQLGRMSDKSQYGKKTLSSSKVPVTRDKEVKV